VKKEGPTGREDEREKKGREQSKIVGRIARRVTK